MDRRPYWLLEITVRDSDRAVIRVARAGISASKRRDPHYREARKQRYRDLLTYHARNRELAGDFSF